MTTFPAPLTRADMLILSTVEDWEARWHRSMPVTTLVEMLGLRGRQRIHDMIGKGWLAPTCHSVTMEVMDVGIAPLGRVQIQLGGLGVPT